MCLFKRENKDTNCGHDECKKFYAANNKPVCVYNLNQTPNSGMMFNNPNLLIQNQAQQKSFTQPSLQSNPMSFQQSLNIKRPSPISEQQVMDPADVIKKKLKGKDDGQIIETNQPQQGVNELAGLNFSDFNILTQQLNQNDNRNLLNNQLLNNFLLLNGAAQNIPKVDNSAPQFNDMVANLLQTQQNPMLSLLNNNKSAFGINPTIKTTHPHVDNNLEEKQKNEHFLSCENFMKEFQSRTMGLLFTQNKMLMEMKEKNDLLQDTLACLIGEINNIKNSLTNSTQEKTVTKAGSSALIHQTLPNSTETVNVETLITYLYGPKQDFQYNLVLKNDLPLPLYRERNFKFTVLLVDGNGKIIENLNRISLTIGIYSSENPPKYIDSNTAGNKILKGFIEKELVNGSATFDKIQIKEVTSHFRNGWIFFVVYPKINKNANNNTIISGNGVVVNTQAIKPLVLEKVIVKAKKTKEKEQSGDSPNSPPNQADGTKEEAATE